MTPMMQMRIQRFKANRRGFWSLWIFLVLFIISLFAELVANDKPLFVSFDGGWYFPVAKQYSEMEFGGEFAAEADYTDPYVQELIEEKGYMIWPVIRFSYDTINYNLPGPAPSAPDNTNWLGTDDRAETFLLESSMAFEFRYCLALCLPLLVASLALSWVQLRATMVAN
ncbi:oligopeptide transport system permease protein oppC [Vibrio ishigakensis]|uniref:Oligopeptide transport system permease protein oppC n=1 Tax=Vibrio ishigakensis TaxID=1481914 RepID=A0A0B8PAQ9_9VIBR|nr:oligopeptide transport system permease protein oppC [Vibrio ishigakensis]